MKASTYDEVTSIPCSIVKTAELKLSDRSVSPSHWIIVTKEKPIDIKVGENVV